MQFNSIEFIFYFLPLFLAVYFILPERFRNAVLLLGSLTFYGLADGGNLRWIIALLVLTFGTFCASMTLRGPERKQLLAVYLSVFAALLVFFKLYEGGEFLPAGMSFYVFQLVAYLIDVYRARILPEPGAVKFASRVAMFPKLLSGPLMEPEKLFTGAANPEWERIRTGIHKLILGLGMKVILANRLGGLWSQAAVTGYDNISVPAAWLALAAYALQLYFDFYGYSLMAVGLGKILGFDLPRNFDHPYASKTVSEFYRRWHITLGAWFREYVYIPLGGNRGGKVRTILNLTFVWLLTGFWHGTGGNYLLWAAFLLFWIVNERLWLGKYLKNSQFLSHGYLILVILLSWVPFAIGDPNQMLTFGKRLFGIGLPAANSADYLIWLRDYGMLLFVGVALAAPIPEKLWKKISDSAVADVLILVLFWIAIWFISTAEQDPFLYFRY